MASPKKIHIGTSGWNYKHWRGNFYPEDLPSSGWFDYYIKYFSTVEINNSFYQLPEKKTFEKWRKSVPENFVFSVKASRYITHMKKLKDPEQPVPNFIDNVKGLQDRLGPVLFQLPPRWNMNADRLQYFISQLPDGFRYTFEFRDDSWWHPDIYQILKDANMAFCIFDLAGTLSPKEITADFIYVRLHGPGAAYQGKYDAKTLSGWAGAFSAWQKQGKEVFCYFDNDQKGYAAQNALELAQMLDNK